MSAGMKRTLSLSLLAACAGFTTALASAGEHNEHGRRSVPMLPQYAQECGSCHVPYSPRLLPAASWRQVVDGLSRHFGTDASLDDATAAAIGTWLEANAASGKRGSMPPDNRITRSAWFVHEHDEIAPATWRRASVKSPSNCGACHAGAAQGDFHEHDVRIPR